MLKHKGVSVEMGGEIYVIPPLALGPLEQLQDRVSKFDGSLSSENIKVVIDAALSALQRNYPDMTREKVADLIDVANMQEVFESIMDISGIKRKQAEAEASAGGKSLAGETSMD